MRAVSYAMFGTVSNVESVNSQVQEHLKKMIAKKVIVLNNEKEIPLCLQPLATSLQEDYRTHPSFVGFDRYNLELVSIVFDVRIELFTADEEGLVIRLIDHNCNECIQISRMGYHYDSLVRVKDPGSGEPEKKQRNTITNY